MFFLLKYSTFQSSIYAIQERELTTNSALVPFAQVIRYIKIIQALAGVAQWTKYQWEPNGLRFDSQAGHKPGLQARSPVGGAPEATTH